MTRRVLTWKSQTAVSARQLDPTDTWRVRTHVLDGRVQRLGTRSGELDTCIGETNSWCVGLNEDAFGREPSRPNFVDTTAAPLASDSVPPVKTRTPLNRDRRDSHVPQRAR